MQTRIAKLTDEENHAWEKAMEYYLNEGKRPLTACSLAWRDVQLEFPRLKDFDGCEA